MQTKIESVARAGAVLPHSTGDRFHNVAGRISAAIGSPWALAIAIAAVCVWGALGPATGYSANWQLVINTGTSIVTFLMIFVLQNSQNRDTKAINIKLDELLRAIEGARTGLAAVGDLTDEELEGLEGEFRAIAANARSASKVSRDAAGT